MKNLAGLLIIALFFTACAQDKQQREESKEIRSVEHKRNAGVDSAAFNDQSQVKDSMESRETP